MTRTIAGSLRALLGSIVDYAGLFPPAKLDMAPTVANYAGDLDGDDAWMLGRLIVPVARLDEFEAEAAGLLPTGEDEEPWRLSGLVAPAGEASLGPDIARIAAFNTLHASPSAGLASIGTIELRAETPEAVDAALDRIPDDVFPFFELPIDEDPRGLIAALSGSDAGAKVRTGGTCVPRPQDLARFVTACVTAGVPFKATAGLHHPLAHQAQAIDAREFGFLNVFIAAALAHHHRLAKEELAGVLVEADPAAFAFTDEHLRYGGLELATPQIDRTRESLAISFGSCSFAEPLERLQALELI